MNAPTLVLVHGAGGDHHVWDVLRKELGLDTIALDLPGRGEGTPCATAGDAARSILATLAARQLDLARTVVVGHSYGGAVAIECALAAPLAGLVLVSTGARLRVHPDVLAAMPARSPVVTPETARIDWLAADAFDRMHDVARITTPTLVVGGDRDTLTPPKYAKFLAQNIPGAELVTLAGAGHMCIEEDAPRVAAAIVRLVDRLSS